jgi:glutamate-1-semialdehyde 2,1-aminomutase
MNAHFADGEIRRPEDLAAVDARLRQLFFFHLLAQGIYASPRGFIVLSLPLADDAIARLEQAVGDFLARFAGLLPRRTAR